MSDAFNYGWSLSAQRYIDLTTGRFVPRADVLGVMQERIEDSINVLKDMASALVNGAADVSEWQAAVATELKNLHTQMAALASGGWDNVSPSTWGEVGARLKAEYQYLNGFAQEIADGNLSLAQIEMRLDMYGHDSWGSYFDAERIAMADGGKIEERRVLTEAKHCDDCIAAAAQSWQPIGTLPDIGDSQCGSNCKCEFEYR